MSEPREFSEHAQPPVRRRHSHFGVNWNKWGAIATVIMGVGVVSPIAVFAYHIALSPSRIDDTNKALSDTNSKVTSLDQRVTSIETNAQASSIRIEGKLERVDDKINSVDQHMQNIERILNSQYYKSSSFTPTNVIARRQ